jgi:golgin subfamily A member 1
MNVNNASEFIKQNTIKKIDQQEQEEIIKKLTDELNEKNKVIKNLQQRLNDMKKTLQKELKFAILPNETPSLSIELPNELDNSSSLSLLSHKFFKKRHSIDLQNKQQQHQQHLHLDEINYKYFKHVLMKFLTSREYEVHSIQFIF